MIAIARLLDDSPVLPILDITPFPKAADRRPWEELDAGHRRHLVAEGEKYLGFEWPLVRVSDYTEYAESGDRSRHAGRYFERRYAIGSLALAECVEGKGRFVKDLVDGIWLVCEETSWVIPAHEPDASLYPGPLPSWRAEEQGIDLFAAETGALISWIIYLLGDGLAGRYPAAYERCIDEVRRRIIGQFLDRDDLWWMGIKSSRHGYLNNWTPWCVSNCLAAILLVEPDADRRLTGVEKAAGCLDRYLEQYPNDGGCDEGPGYWMAASGALCDALDLLRIGTADAADGFGKPLVREMAAYLWRVHVGGDWFVNFGDGNAKLSPPPELLYRYGKRIGDQVLMDLGLSFLADEPEIPARWYPMLRRLSYLFSHDEMEEIKSAATGSAVIPALSSYESHHDTRRITWLPDSEIFVCKGETLFVAAKGAHNGESHNHNDVGQFVIFSDHVPFIVDAGVTEYTRKTFSPERYDIWAMQSGYHNLPSIGGFDQLPGREYRAKNSAVRHEDGSETFSLELQSAYPPETGIVLWRREVEYRERSGGAAAIYLRDSYQLENTETEVVLHLMTPWVPEIIKNGEDGTTVTLGADNGSLLGVEIPGGIAVSSEVVSFDDSRLAAVWGTRLYRLCLTVKGTPGSGGWEIRFLPSLKK